MKTNNVFSLLALTNRRFRRGRVAFLIVPLAFILLTQLAACVPPFQRYVEPDVSGPGIRVVTWNIQWFPGYSDETTKSVEDQHWEDVLDYLPGLEPDILVLQEIRDEETAQGLVDSVPGLDLHVATHFERPWLEGTQQIVIASRYPARAGFAELFTDIYDDKDTEPFRGFAFAALETPLGGTMLVYGVHLKSNRGEVERNVPMREESARQILRHVEVMSEVYAEDGPISVVVAGDFNLLLERKEMAHEQTMDLFMDEGFHSTWEEVPFKYRVTWPGRGSYGDACFDYILTRGLPELRARLLYKPDWELSDHRPVLLHIPLDESDGATSETGGDETE